MEPSIPPRSWTRTTADSRRYLVATDRDLISRPFLSAALAAPDAYWAKPLPASAIDAMLANSLVFGLYDVSSDEEERREQIGIVRVLTDGVTFAYLSDVYVARSARGTGLGRWLVRCVGEVLEGMPHLRRVLVLARDEARSRAFYEEALGVSVMERGSGSGSGTVVMQRVGPGAAPGT